MIIKSKENSQKQVDYLTDLLERNFPDEKKSLIERELKCLYSGNKGEDTSSYYLDFDLKKTKNWALIHDLRLEHDGNVAQIDHLLIGRMMDIYVIESKNFKSGVVISDEGDFSYFYKNRPCAIPSPISQNERHIRFLDRFLLDNDLLPRRLGVPLKPSYRNIVLISPESRLTKPKNGTYDCSGVMKSDKFLECLKNDSNDDSLSEMMKVAKIISSQSLQSFTEKLAYHHKPIEIDYVAKFGLQERVPQVGNAELPNCPQCGKEMVTRSAKKGKNIGKDFLGCIDFPRCRGVLEIRSSEDIQAADSVEVEKSTDKAVSDDVPACPKCEANMVKRISKKGKNVGKEFWGCTTFPKCFGSLPVTE